MSKFNEIINGVLNEDQTGFNTPSAPTAIGNLEKNLPKQTTDQIDAMAKALMGNRSLVLDPSKPDYDLNRYVKDHPDQKKYVDTLISAYKGNSEQQTQQPTQKTPQQGVQQNTASNQQPVSNTPSATYPNLQGLGAK